jgi:cytochrome c-type biogenesis protein CcmE
MNRKPKRIGLIVGLATVLGAFGYLLAGGIGDNLVYFVTPEELVARGSGAYDSPVRLGGQVKEGTVRWDADALDLQFELTDGKADVYVYSKGAPPQMFRDGMGVVVEGKMTPAGFQSTNLLVMHSNEYRAPTEGNAPQERYHQLERRATILPRGDG